MNEIDVLDQVADSGAEHMLEHAEHRAVVRQLEPADHRVELYARLRTVIDTATESIRTLRQENAVLERENAEVSDRNSMLEQRLHAATVDLEGDELALRQSAEMLEQVLRGEVVSPPDMNGASEPTTRGEVPEIRPVGGNVPLAEVSNPLNLVSEPTPRHGLFRRS